MDESQRLRFLFAKYLEQECSAQELDELISLLQKADADNVLLEPMQTLWEELKAKETSHTVDWKKMYSSVISSQEHTDVLINRATSKTRWKYYSIAAVFLLVICLPVYFFIYHPQDQVAGQVSVKPVKEMNEQIVKNRQTIHLPDGSTAILNTESKLNYPSAFSGKRRDVYLTGEGFFDIRHNPAQPFYVHTGKIVIKVLGTAFNIKAYSASDNIEITVTRGKIQVLKENKVLGVLTASQQITFLNETENIITTKVDTLPVIAWKPAEIFFNNITMEEAVRQIEERFKTKIEFANPAVKNCRVTATFSEDDMEEEILAVICAVSKADYKNAGDKIIIDGKGCK